MKTPFMLLVLGVLLIAASVSLAQDLTVTLVPEEDPVTVPAGGAWIPYDVVVTNNTDMPITFDYWTSVIMPDGWEPDRSPRRSYGRTLQPGETRTAHFEQCVPWCMPEGEYTYFGYVGDFQETVIEQDSFQVIKLSPTATGLAASEPAHNEDWGGFRFLGWDDGYDGGNELDQDLELTLIPDDNPITIPPGGGWFTYGVEVTNTTNDPITFDYWTSVLMPDGWEPERSPRRTYDRTLQPGETRIAYFEQCVPWCMPEGEYTYYGYVGEFQGVYYDMDSFQITKLSNDVGGLMPSENYLEHWDGAEFLGWADDAESGVFSAAGVPADYAVTSVYPNPFNPTTTVTINLPDAADLRVNVFNSLGREVAVLANGTVAAGTHDMVFDARALPSGVYFINAFIPGKMNEMRRVTLVK